MVQRDITGRETLARASDSVSTIDRYDLLLGLIPTAFAVALLAGRIFGLSFETTVLGGVVVASLAPFDGLFLRPPTALRAD